MTQLTDNNFDDQGASISGDNVAWQAKGEIYLYDGNATSIISDNGLVNTTPTVSGSSIVWWADEPGQNGERKTAEIFFYDGTNQQQITDNDFADIWPQVSGSNITWLGIDGDDSAVYFYNGMDTRILSTEVDSSARPKIFGDNVVWAQNDGNDAEIFLFDAKTGVVSQITNNNVADVSPEIDGQNIVWESRDVNTRILRNDGFATTEIDSGIGLNGARVAGERLVWHQEFGGSLGEVFLFDGTDVLQLTNSVDVRDLAPDLSETVVAWAARKDDMNDILAFDGTEISMLATTPFDESLPRVSGNQVVWWASDGMDDEIYLAKLVPEPSANFLLSFVLISLPFARAKRKSLFEHTR